VSWRRHLRVSPFLLVALLVISIGPLAAILYVQADAPKADASASRTEAQAERVYLRKRDKGKVDTELKSLVYVRRIRLGEEALEEARRKAK